MNFVITDTCIILMLIRIQPLMFKEDKYKCKCPPVVFSELLGNNSPFRKKYPFIHNYKQYYKPYYLGKKKEQVKFYEEEISKIANANGLGVSSVDVHVLAVSLVFGHSLSTGDDNLIKLATEHFEVENISALGIINYWLENNLLDWSDEKHDLLFCWKNDKEHLQPKEEIKKFEKLTKRKFFT